ncbi:YaiI/YqxD family protein [Methylophaga thalassica]|uniref:YaiI/YqxD family protein n=1 Tax=Methylophaga thalassica TaxID=40223 RepID=UPI002E7ABE15|nr:YaiI/YqxD family protein [Methylophaga thalassica]WVI84583.1 YaiI/YqxD family protein [Methylophaga thalassica]
MHIWVDADACPAVIKEILIRASRRTSLPLTFIANHAIKVPADNQIQFIQVASGFDMADNEIASRVQVKDLVITADIPLANDVIDRGGICLSPRGELMDKSNIAARLTMRNFMDTMRSSGVDTGGQNAFNHRDRMQFANQLDKIIQSSL